MRSHSPSRVRSDALDTHTSVSRAPQVVARVQAEGEVTVAADGCGCECASGGALDLRGEHHQGAIVVFLGVFLLPEIRGLRRVLLLDNHSTRFGDEMEALLRAEGHIYVARPPNSPEFAPTEPMFHLIEQSLKTHRHLDTSDDNLESVSLESVAADAVSMITAERVKSSFVHCHYGRDYNHISTSIPGAECD